MPPKRLPAAGSRSWKEKLQLFVKSEYQNEANYAANVVGQRLVLSLARLETCCLLPSASQTLQRSELGLVADLSTCTHFTFYCW